MIWSYLPNGYAHSEGLVEEVEALPGLGEQDVGVEVPGERLAAVQAERNAVVLGGDAVVLAGDERGDIGAHPHGRGERCRTPPPAPGSWSVRAVGEDAPVGRRERRTRTPPSGPAGRNRRTSASHRRSRTGCTGTPHRPPGRRTGADPRRCASSRRPRAPPARCRRPARAAEARTRSPAQHVEIDAVQGGRGDLGADEIHERGVAGRAGEQDRGGRAERLLARATGTIRQVDIDRVRADLDGGGTASRVGSGQVRSIGHDGADLRQWGLPPTGYLTGVRSGTFGRQREHRYVTQR